MPVAMLGWICEARASPLTESLFLGRWARNRTRTLHTLFRVIGLWVRELKRAANHCTRTGCGQKKSGEMDGGLFLL